MWPADMAELSADGWQPNEDRDAVSETVVHCTVKNDVTVVFLGRHDLRARVLYYSGLCRQ